MNNNINLFTTEELQEVHIEDYRGYWGEIDRLTHNNTTYVLFEHNTYGDETCYIVAKLCPISETRHVTIKDKNYVLIEKDDIVDETFDGLVQCLYDCGIIDNMEEYENE